MSLPPVISVPGKVGFNRTPLFRMRSGSLTVTDADKDQNIVFNTNLGAINVQMAMFIHRMDFQCNINGWPGAALTNLYVSVLSENTAATSALLQGNDTRSLWLKEKDYNNVLITTGGSGFVDNKAISRIELDPWPIITIAQQLNFLCELVEVVAVSSPDLVASLDLWYTLEPINAELRSRLIERLNLAL